MSESNGNRSGDGRNRDGTFAAGWKGGPGRPRRAVEQEYLDATMAACTVEDWQAIATKAVEQAKGGDDKARIWLARALGIDGIKIRHADAWGDALEPEPRSPEEEKRLEAEIAVQRQEDLSRLTEAFEIAKRLGLATEQHLVGGTGDDDDTEVDR